MRVLRTCLLADVRLELVLHGMGLALVDAEPLYLHTTVVDVRLERGLDWNGLALPQSLRS